jgi:uncharacterized integral membrane protein (TIGR00698 family)
MTGPFSSPVPDSWRERVRGTGLAALAGAASLGFAWWASRFGYTISSVLFAFFIGLALANVAIEPRFKPGVQFAASTVLRIGVAILGVRLTIGQLFDVGWLALVVAVVAVGATIPFGAWCARRLGLSAEFGVLTATGVGVCGVAAATAAASVLPRHVNADRDLVFAALGCNAISTVCMLLYAPMVAGFGLDERLLGIFLGGSIHDVAQVVGAGKAAGERVLDVAVVTKLLRVALLLPAVVGIAWWVRRRAKAAGDAPATRYLPPWFLLLFVVFAGLVSVGAIPPAAQQTLSTVSTVLITVAIAALGMKTSLRGLLALGSKPVLLMGLETVFVAAIVLVAVLVLG